MKTMLSLLALVPAHFAGQGRRVLLSAINRREADGLLSNMGDRMRDDLGLREQWARSPADRIDKLRREFHL